VEHPVVTDRVLHRTLLARQHLLERAESSPLAEVEHLVGLQAQETVPPYLSLHARLRGFRAAELSRLLEERHASRSVLMRGTIHLVSARDCLALRPLLQPVLDRVVAGTDFGRHCADLDRDELLGAADRLLRSGPVPVKELGARLAEHFPQHRAGHLATTVRMLLPLVQTPPRGVLGKGGAPAYVHAEAWHGQPVAPADPRDLVRRYLRAFGPASAADLTTWSGLRGTRELLAAMGDELATYRTEGGRLVHDLAGLPLADGDEPAPVRLLGTYDNLWLSHDDRGRVTDLDKRRRWMGRNGGTANVVLVDGRLEGLWRLVDGHVEVEELRRLTRAERAELAAEAASVEGLLAGSG
jgi:hypothetical protein